MENYTRGEVREVEDPYPFPEVEESLQMRITAGSKLRNVMGFAMKRMGAKETRRIAWNGSGPSVPKTITCAEIMKRKLKNLHQITKIRFKRIEEHWIPQVEGLEPLKVNRDIPAISILLSKDPLDSAEPGYQAPGSFDFWQENKQADNNRAGRRRPKPSRKFGGHPEGREGGGAPHHHRYHPKAKKTSGTKAPASGSSARPSASASHTDSNKTGES